MMTREKARKILDLGSDPTDGQVKAAFVKKLREAHPDTSLALVGDVQEIKQAKDCLLSGALDPDAYCKMCNGRGYILTVPASSCNQCKGTGLR